MQILSAAQMQYRTTPSSGGTVNVGVVSVAWNSGMDLNTVLGAMSVGGVAFGLDATQRVVAIGTNPTPTFANPAQSVTIVDRGGNLTMALNMEAQPNFGVFTATMLAQVSAQYEGAKALKGQADGIVDQLTIQRDAIMKVNVDAEKIQLVEYSRAYEAAVKAMAALDEMLNVLINRMAVTTSDGSSSVLTS
jgi:flagellar hook-associated protein FlgK